MQGLTPTALMIIPRMGLSFSVFEQLEAQGEKALGRLLGDDGDEEGRGQREKTTKKKKTWIGALSLSWVGWLVGWLAGYGRRHHTASLSRTLISTCTHVHMQTRRPSGAYTRCAVAWLARWRAR